MGYNIEDYLPFTVNDDNFFSDPNRNAHGYSIPIPEGWKSFYDLHWQYFLNPKIELPEQGWKIHLSAGYSDTNELFQTVAKYLFDKKVVFKVTVSEE